MKKKNTFIKKKAIKFKNENNQKKNHSQYLKIFFTSINNNINKINLLK
jgi:hypothetical protein